MRILEIQHEGKKRMNIPFFDIIVAKEYETKHDGITEKKTAWNKDGRAWQSKSNDSLSFELFLFPNQRYVLQLRDRRKDVSIETSPQE